MLKHTSIVVPVFAIACAAAFAVYHSSAPATPKPAVRKLETTAGALDTPSPTLPPGHPAIAGMGMGAAHGGLPAPDEEPSPAALTWRAPHAWTLTPNASTMRLATYRIPRSVGDTEDAELSVVRAGGSADANIDRWLGQFSAAGKETRAVTTVRGMTVTQVEVHGTFMGGGMAMGAASGSHPGWTLLAAIVQTPGEPYFFKMTGPTPSVTAARPAFDALVASVTPASK